MLHFFLRFEALISNLSSPKVYFSLTIRSFSRELAILDQTIVELMNCYFIVHSVVIHIQIRLGCPKKIKFDGEKKICGFLSVSMESHKFYGKQ